LPDYQAIMKKHHTIKFGGGMLALCSLLSLTQLAQAQVPGYDIPPIYSFVDLGAFGSSVTGGASDDLESVAYDINESDQVVGYSRGYRNNQYYTNSFFWNNASGIQTMGTLDVQDNIAFALNDYGHAVGNYGTSAFLWDANNASAGQGVLYTDGQANDINNNGVVVGQRLDSGSGNSLAYSWDTANATGTDLGALSGDNESNATAIHDNGTVVGYSTGSSLTRAFDLTGGTMNDIGDLINGNTASTLLFDTNVYGVSVGEESQLGIIWDSYWGASSIGTLDTYSYSSLYKINDKGWAVGYASDIPGVSGFGNRNAATLWFNSTLYDLSTLITLPSGWATLERAYSINENGSIVGYGTLDSGEKRAFMLQVTAPEPGTLALCGMGILSLVARRRRVATGDK
jgi:probable HAF family extracellular repeat protein